MEIIISGHHVDLTEELKAYATERAEKLLKYFDGIMKITVKLSSDSGMLNAEMIISARNHLVLVGEVQHRDLHAAIDLVTDKMERQLTRQKEKMKNHRDERHLGEVAAAERARAQQEDEDDNVDDEVDE